MKLSERSIAQARTNKKTSITASMIVQAAVNEHDATELHLFVENESKIYPQKVSIIVNLLKKIKKGQYNEDLAWKAWMHWVDVGAKLYADTLATKGSEKMMFPRELRMQVAKQVAKDQFAEMKTGNYDSLLDKNAKSAVQANSVNCKHCGESVHIKDDETTIDDPYVGSCPHCGKDSEAPVVPEKEAKSSLPPEELKSFTADELREMPTLAQGQSDNLKYDDGEYRVWLARTGVADGEPYDNRISIEENQDGRWVKIEDYQG
jgi:hypothetical protein